MNEQIRIVINCLDIGTLLKIKRQCETYVTYCVDNKQLNDRNQVKTNIKNVTELLEFVNFALIAKQFDNKNEGNGNNSEGLKSTMTEEPKKKTKKEKKET